MRGYNQGYTRQRKGGKRNKTTVMCLPVSELLVASRYLLYHLSLDSDRGTSRCLSSSVGLATAIFEIPVKLARIIALAELKFLNEEVTALAELKFEDQCAKRRTLNLLTRAISRDK